MADLYVYQRFVVGKCSPQTKKSKSTMLNAAALGLTGEGGEFADQIKKILFHAHPLTRELRDKLVLEVGDVLFYCALAAEALDVDLDTIIQANMEKLNNRYPNGFDSAISQKRYADAIGEPIKGSPVEAASTDEVRQQLAALQERRAHAAAEGGATEQPLVPVRITETVTREAGAEALGLGEPPNSQNVDFPRGYAIGGVASRRSFTESGRQLEQDEGER